MEAIYSTKNLALIGKLLVYKKPELATALLSCYTPTEKPTESDLTKIRTLYLAYCYQNDLDPEEYTGKVRVIYKNHFRKLFISAILRLYNPEIYQVPRNLSTPCIGLQKAISEAIGADKTKVCRWIKEVVLWERTDEEYKLRVFEIVEQLKERKVA